MPNLRNRRQSVARDRLRKGGSSSNGRSEQHKNQVLNTKWTNQAFIDMLRKDISEGLPFYTLIHSYGESGKKKLWAGTLDDLSTDLVESNTVNVDGQELMVESFELRMDPDLRLNLNASAIFIDIALSDV